MRTQYSEDLQRLHDKLAEMTGSVLTAVTNAATAMADSNPDLAQAVIDGDAAIDAQHREIEELSIRLLATQSPVAGDLRGIVAALAIIADLGRSGDLAAHVARTVIRRAPEHAVPEPLRDSFQAMSQGACDLTARVSELYETDDAEAARQLAVDDTAIDQLRNEQFAFLLSDEWDHGVEAGVDVALLSRYWERIADHAVAVAGRLIFFFEGEGPTGKDWPTT